MHQSAIVLSVLPGARGILNLQGAEMPERTWFRKHTMSTWELEEQLACWLWKDDCSAGNLGQKEWDLEPEGQPLSGEVSQHWCLYIASTVQNGGTGSHLQALCNIQSCKEVHAGGFLYPHSAPLCRHASASFSLHNSSIDLLQDHLPPLMRICSFSACQASSEFKRKKLQEIGEAAFNFECIRSGQIW